LLAIDPALAYIGGQSKEQGDVTPFLRNGLNPLLREFDCGGIVSHHTKQAANWPGEIQLAGGRLRLFGRRLCRVGKLAAGDPGTPLRWQP